NVQLRSWNNLSRQSIKISQNLCSTPIYTDHSNKCCPKENSRGYGTAWNQTE
ncbi:hypothetical protein QYM36_004398, partial [Artemia franciscana]